jgi:hypothetical protein
MRGKRELLRKSWNCIAKREVFAPHLGLLWVDTKLMNFGERTSTQHTYIVSV